MQKGWKCIGAQSMKNGLSNLAKSTKWTMTINTCISSIPLSKKAVSGYPSSDYWICSKKRSQLILKTWKLICVGTVKYGVSFLPNMGTVRADRRKELELVKCGGLFEITKSKECAGRSRRHW